MKSVLLVSLQKAAKTERIPRRQKEDTDGCKPYKPLLMGIVYKSPFSGL